MIETESQLRTRVTDAFWAALMFYTRAPVPARWARHSTQALQQGRMFLPLVGVLVGLWGAAVYWLVAGWLPASLAVVASMVATVVATGAFHEDGLADVCDGIGGGWERDRILEIMKDSRVGSFATAGLMLALLAKFSALLELARTDWQLPLAAMVAAHTLSRWVSSLVIDWLPYAEPPGSKAKPIANYELSLPQHLLGVLTVTIALILTLPAAVAMVAVGAALLTAVGMGSYFRSWIGGYTGDCLGAIQQVSEIIIYAVVVACV